MRNLILGPFRNWLLFPLGLLVCLAGCGESKIGNGNSPDLPQAVPTSAQPASSQPASTQPDLVAMQQQKLVGVWLGEAYLDERRLEQKLQSLDAEHQQQMIQRAGTFLTTVMAIDFRADGTMENEGEVTPHGQRPVRLGGQGTWRVIEAQEDRMIVETVEQLPDGSTNAVRQAYRFYPDGKKVAMMISMKDELDTCNPMIIFTRQFLQPTNVAQQPGESVRK